MLLLNEEKNIQKCLRSVPWVDEVIVVDSFSTDQTIEVAKLRGAKVFSEPWLGYGPQKKMATDFAKNDWVLNLDADERLSEELSLEIYQSFAELQNKPEVGYLIPRKSFHLGKWIQYGGWYPDYQLRFYNKKFCNWDSSQIHESVQAKIKKKSSEPIHFE